jgi:hypothetical protein
VHGIAHSKPTQGFVFFFFLVRTNFFMSRKRMAQRESNEASAAGGSRSILHHCTVCPLFPSSLSLPLSSLPPRPGKGKVVTNIILQRVSSKWQTIAITASAATRSSNDWPRRPCQEPLYYHSLGTFSLLSLSPPFPLPFPPTSL